MSALPADVRHLSWAAEHLGISLSTCYRLALAGGIPGAFKVGAQWRVSVPAFMATVHQGAS
jgi:excisionase family DNA binding protein